MICFPAFLVTFTFNSTHGMVIAPCYNPNTICACLVISLNPQISTNGLVSFNLPYTSWYPVQFPYGRRQIPIIAPYWTDFDFRNNLGSESAVFYQTYTRGSDGASDSLLETFAQRLSEHTTNSQGVATGFDPDWMLVVTWYQATPYYGRFNQDEVRRNED